MAANNNNTAYFVAAAAAAYYFRAQLAALLKSTALVSSSTGSGSDWLPKPVSSGFSYAGTASATYAGTASPPTAAPILTIAEQHPYQPTPPPAGQSSNDCIAAAGWPGPAFTTYEKTAALFARCGAQGTAALPAHLAGIQKLRTVWVPGRRRS